LIGANDVLVVFEPIGVAKLPVAPFALFALGANGEGITWKLMVCYFRGVQSQRKDTRQAQMAYAFFLCTQQLNKTLFIKEAARIAGIF
jgi:hypothetical protein